MIETREDAYRLLIELGAPQRLLVHVRLVGEAADQLIAEYADLGLAVDERLIRLGVAVHDAGKIHFPAELEGPGSMHEPAGEALLLEHASSPALRDAVSRMRSGKA